MPSPSCPARTAGTRNSPNPSVLPNWRRECRKFTPHLNVAVLHGADRHDDRHRIETADILLTTYTLLWRDQAFYEQVPLAMQSD